MQVFSLRMKAISTQVNVLSSHYSNRWRSRDWGSCKISLQSCNEINIILQHEIYFTWGFSIGLSFREKDGGLSLGSESYDTLWVSLGGPLDNGGLEAWLGEGCSKSKGIGLDSPSQTQVTLTQQSCVGQFGMLHGYCWQTWSSGSRWPPGCLELEGPALEGSRGASCGHP